MLLTSKPLGAGTGLGLPLCRELVGAMGGTLSLRSVDLPLAD